MTKGIRLIVVLLSAGLTACTGLNLASAAAPSTAPDAYVHTWHFSSNDGGGYSESGSISVGEPERFHAELLNGSQVAGNECVIDPATDAVVPLQISLTNTSTGQSTVPSVGLSVDGGTGFRPTTTAPVGIQLEIGPCFVKGQPAIVGCPPVPVPPGTSCNVDGFAWVQDYYRTTSSASGNRRGLAVAAITLTVCSHKSDWYCRPSTLSDSSLAGANPATVLRVGRSSFSFDLAAQPILGQAAEQVPRPLWTGSSACKAIPRCAGSR